MTKPRADNPRKPKRNAKGHFLKGESGNPNGKSRTYGEMVQIARRYTPEAIRTLAEIMTGTEFRGSERVAAAKTLLDRAWGTAPQLVRIEADVKDERDTRGYLEPVAPDHVARVARILADVGALGADTIDAQPVDGADDTDAD